jgi:hypothetical protein
MSETILEEAARIVDGPRQANYGHPREDFTRTAGLLTALFRHKLKNGESFRAEDVPLIMMCVKISRHVHQRNRDNMVDIAGYARTDEKLDE